MADDSSSTDDQFREIVGGLGPILVTDDMGVWDFFHGIIQTWDSLGMTDELDRSIAEYPWFAEFVADPLAWCKRIAYEWCETERLPEWLRDWVRDHMAGIVHFMEDHDLKRIRLWVNVPGDDWLYMLWDTAHGFPQELP